MCGHLHLKDYPTTLLNTCSVPKYLRISRKHAHAEFFQQTTPHYLREGPHNSAKVTEIIDTSANTLFFFLFFL